MQRRNPSVSRAELWLKERGWKTEGMQGEIKKAMAENTEQQP